MRTRAVALATRDPSLYAELAAVVRERRLPTVSVLPGDRIPENVAVVLTSPSEATEITARAHVLAVPSEGDRTALWAEVQSVLGAAPRTGELVVGIDPGPRPGYAILDGDSCIGQGILEDPEAVGRLGAHLRRRFAPRPIRFRVGRGDRPARNRIVNALLPIHRPVELVDEEGTTPRGHRRPRDAAAAREIARSAGRPVHAEVELIVTPGEVANLQRLSREGSGGQFTITRLEAGRVLRGEITFSDALAAAERRYGRGGTARRREPPGSERS